jgi:transposase
MVRFVEGADRSQLSLLPDCLEDWVDEDNSVHVIEAFVEALDPAALAARALQRLNRSILLTPS